MLGKIIPSMTVGKAVVVAVIILLTVSIWAWFIYEPPERKVSGTIESIDYEGDSYAVKINDTVYPLENIEADGYRLRENESYVLTLKGRTQPYELVSVEGIRFIVGSGD